MKRACLFLLIVAFAMSTVAVSGVTVSAYSSHSDCDSQYSPDLIFWQRSPQRQAQYNICASAIDGQWGDLSSITGYEKCAREAYKYDGGISSSYDYNAIIKSCMYGIYGEELSEDPEEKEALEEVDDQVEDDTISRGPAWSQHNLETYCEGYKEDKENGNLKEEYESCLMDGTRYRVYAYQGKYYGEVINILPKCEDSFFLGGLICAAAQGVTDIVNAVVNNLLLPMLQWRILV